MRVRGEGRGEGRVWEEEGRGETVGGGRRGEGRGEGRVWEEEGRGEGAEWATACQVHWSCHVFLLPHRKTKEKKKLIPVWKLVSS